MTLSDIGRTIEMNADQMKHFFESMIRLAKRIIGGTEKLYKLMIEWI
jgi:hypothetical protein